MKTLVQCFEAVAVDVGVDLGGGDVGMPKHHLHGPEVGSAGEQVGGKGMAEHMGAHCFVDAGGPGVLPDDLPEPVAGHACPSIGKKKVVAPLFLEEQGPAMVKIALDNGAGSLVERYQPFFIAFANNPDMAAGHVTALNREADQFGYPYACGIEQVKHGPVAQYQRSWLVSAGLQEPLDFAQGECLG